MPDDPITTIARARGMHAFWRDQKVAAINKLSASDKEKGKKLAELFDQGLGPKIDEYYTEWKKFTGPNSEIGSNLATQSVKVYEKAKAVHGVCRDYKNSLNKSNFQSKSVLVAVLDSLDATMVSELTRLRTTMRDLQPPLKTWPSGFPNAGQSFF